MMTMMDESQNQEYGRPRRANPDTVSYLRGLPLDENLAAQQVRFYVDHFQNSPNNEGSESIEPLEFPALLTATHAALSSIHNELASLSCEENSSVQVETLVRIACRYSSTSKRAVLACMSGYWPFLCTHRFGSHVAQTILRCAVAKCDVDLDEFDEEGKIVAEDTYKAVLSKVDVICDGHHTSTPLHKLLLQSLEELKPYASELAVHVCGTHVLRSALCILSGVEFVDAYTHQRTSTSMENKEQDWNIGPLAVTRRGKVKDKKKKKKGNAATDADISHSRREVTIMTDLNMIVELQNDQFKNDSKILLQEMVDFIFHRNRTGKNKNNRSERVRPPGELQQRTCHPSAGPLLIQIIRLFSYLDHRSKHTGNMKTKAGIKSDFLADQRLGLLPTEPQYSCGSEAEKLVHQLLCWDSSIIQNENSNDSGDNQSVADSVGITKQSYVGEIMYGLSGEPRGSILLETILRSCPDSFHESLCLAGGFYEEKLLREYINHGVSNFVVQTLCSTMRSQNQTTRLVKSLKGIIEDGSILNYTDNNLSQPCTNKRMGIIWRAVEMCAVKGSPQDQEEILHAIMRGYASISAPSTDTKLDNTEPRRKKRSKAKGLSAADCISPLLGFKPTDVSEENGPMSDGRIVLDAAGARALYHIFHLSERLRYDWVKGLVNVYGQDDLVKIANDGLGSRCIMDGLLDGPAKTLASKLLLQKLSSRIAFLATERIGHHFVIKLFRASPIEEKATISATLSQSLNRLGSNAMGRSVMASCFVKEFLESDKVWKEVIAKQEEKDHWLKELLGDGGSMLKAKKQKKHKRQKTN